MDKKNTLKRSQILFVKKNEHSLIFWTAWKAGNVDKSMHGII